MVNLPNSGVPITGALKIAKDWYQFFADLLRDVQSRLSTATMAGVVVPFAGTTEPAGWLFCYGQAVSRTTYAALFSAISTTYGTGDGSTTFNLPDLRGRVVAGQDDMGGTSANRLTSPLNGDTLGAAGGAEGVTLTTAEIPAHSHSLPEGTSGTPIEANPGARFRGGYTNAGATSGSSTGTGSAGSGGAHNNVQPTIILNYIICTGL
jgi:microcystin-dependent protein